MSTPITPTPSSEEQTGPFTIEISISWFLDKFCRGLDSIVVVSREFGLYLQSKDPTEQVLHVEYPSYTKTLCQVYPISSWRASVRRLDVVKQASELERQTRYAKEEAAKALASKYVQREIEIKRVLLLFTSRFPGFINKNSAKLCRAIVVQSLQGKTKPEIQKALGICKDTIDEFLALPQPELNEEELLMGLIKEPEKSTGEVKVSIV